MEIKNKQKIGLALGSGGVRGLAHIGIIKVLLKNNIPIDYISGSSAGALIGAYLATHGEVNSLEKLLLENNKEFLPIFFDFGLKGGFITGKKINKFLEKILNNIEFSEAKIPLLIVTTDLRSGQSIIFSSGKIAPAVSGSISVPIVFKPTNYQGKYLIDGGLSNPVPVDILNERGINKVIAVNLYHKNEFNDRNFTFSKIALRSTRIALHNLSKIAVSNASLVINPDLSKYLNKLSLTAYIKKENIKKIIASGEEEANRFLPEIKRLIKIGDKNS